MLLLRFCAGLMAWTAVFAANLLCAACAMLAFMKVPYCLDLPAHLLRPADHAAAWAVTAHCVLHLPTSASLYAGVHMHASPCVHGNAET